MHYNGMNRAVFLSFLTIACGWPLAGAEAQLVGQRTVGTQRICTYATRQTNGRRTPDHETRVGLGEPCPSNYHAEESAPPVAIPSMAMLQGARILHGQKICRYAYSGQTYDRPIAITGQCPMTPHFFE